MRNHPLYNERLASRGEILISKESSWEPGQRACGDDEPRQGRQADAYPESFMRMVAHSMFYFRLPYRQMEGLLRTYNSNNCNNGNCNNSNNSKGIFPMIPDYTSIHRRICKLEEEIRCQGGGRKGRTGNNNIILATGSTGISVTNRGQ